jgi:hypothetical protein
LNLRTVQQHEIASEGRAAGEIVFDGAGVEDFVVYGHLVFESFGASGREFDSDAVLSGSAGSLFQVILFALAVVVIDLGEIGSGLHIEASIQGMAALPDSDAQRAIEPRVGIAALGGVFGSQKSFDVAVRVRGPMLIGHDDGFGGPGHVHGRAEHAPMQPNSRRSREAVKEVTDAATITNNDKLIRIEKAYPLEASESVSNAIFFGGRRGWDFGPIEESYAAGVEPGLEDGLVIVSTEVVVEEEVADTGGVVVFEPFG